MSPSLDDVESLYVSEHRRLERIAARKVGSANAADVVQDVFAALWSRARDHIAWTPAYLSRATQNAAISRFRAERRRSRFFDRVVEEQYAAPVILPDQAVAARQDLRRLNETIAALPDRTRRIFLLNRLHHCSYDEIAAVLGLSYSTVEREIARAILACRQSVR